MSPDARRNLTQGIVLWVLAPLCAAVAVGAAVYFLLGPTQIGDDRRAPAATPSPAPPTFSVALVPERNVFEQRRRYLSLCGYLSARLAMPVRIKSLPDYGQVLKEIAQGKVDAAFLGSFTYVLAHRQAGVRVIARPLWKDGSSTYRGYVFVRADSGIDTPAQMQGKVLALVDRGTTAGFLFPSAHFRAGGVGDLQSFFSKVLYTGSHDVAAMAVFRGQADVGAAKADQYEELAAADPAFRSQMKVLARSPESPSNGLAVRAGLPAAVLEGLDTALLKMHEFPDGRAALDALGAQRFIPTSDSDYDNVYTMAEQLGIHLETFVP